MAWTFLDTSLWRWVALLLFAFHTRLMEVWWRNAVVYDLLCFTFFYLAACLYVSARKAGRMPGLARSGVILGRLGWHADAVVLHTQ